MPIIPLKQKVSIRKLISEDLDGWSTKVYADPVEYKVRATESEEIVTNQLGEERKSELKLYFNKFTDVTYQDEVTFTNERGETIVRPPLSIRPIRLISGKPTLTKIYL